MRVHDVVGQLVDGPGRDATALFENAELAAHAPGEAQLLLDHQHREARVPVEIEKDVAAALAGEPHSLVDVGHRYAAVSVEGPHAAVLLAAGCPLDLHAKTFVAGSATRTLFGRAEIILWRMYEAPIYRVECARSYARYFDAFLREAAREFA